MARNANNGDMAAAKSIEELFPLIEYCRAGNLRAVSEWIEERKPLDLPEGKRTRRSSPLQIAIEKGFLTLAEMLLNGGADPQANGGNALWDAVNHRRSDIAELLLDRGVPLETVDFSSVCYSGDHALIKLFLNRGADPVKGNPFYHGFRHCLQPMLGVYKTQLEKIPALQIQADIALCHYAKEGNLRGVSLLIWAGARPDAVIPEGDTSEDFGGSFALLEAYRSGHVPILKRMKVENFPKKLPELFNAFSMDDGNTALEYLLKLHPSLSQLPDGGTQMLNHAFWNLGWAVDPKQVFGSRSLTKIDACIERIEYLVKHGAKWKPEPDSHRYSRRHIRHLEPDRILRLFSILHENKAADVELMESLVGTPTMRAHLGDYARKVARLFHPPPPKKSKPEVTLSQEPATPPPRPATTAELTDRAQTFLLDLVKEAPGKSFWEHRTLTFMDNQKDRKVLGMAKDDERSRLEIFQKAAEKVNQRARSFEVSVDGKDYRRTVRTITVSLKGESEWNEVFDELFRDCPDQNPRQLTAPARKLLGWLQKHGSPGVWRSERALSEEAELEGSQESIGVYLQELRRKLGLIVHMDSRKAVEGGREFLEYRAWLDSNLSAVSAENLSPVSMNRVFSSSLGRLSKRDVDEWRASILDYILTMEPTGTAPVYLLWISSRRELRRLFPSHNTDITSYGREIAELVSELRLPDTVKLGYDFRGSYHWMARVVPEIDWETTLPVLKELRDQPTLRDRYGLSEDAGRLLEWIEEIPAEKRIGEWTPIVEEEMDRKIGIKCPWDQENIPAYIQFLLDEINQKTGYDLGIQPWKSFSRLQTRIRVRKKRSEEAMVIQSIQLLGLQNGKMLPEEIVRDLLRELME